MILTPVLVDWPVDVAWSISSSAQYALQKYFSHPSLIIYFSPNLSIKLKLKLQIGGRLLMTTHLAQSNYLTSQQHVRLCCAFYQP
jgi:hypothetical protein